jgi:hypothetical protein
LNISYVFDAQQQCEAQLCTQQSNPDFTIWAGQFADLQHRWALRKVAIGLLIFETTSACAWLCASTQGCREPVEHNQQTPAKPGEQPVATLKTLRKLKAFLQSFSRPCEHDYASAITAASST